MSDVKLLRKMGVEESASYAALICYTSKLPVIGKTIIDVLLRLFKPSHHTTLQHAATYESFAFENMPVGEITLGLHLSHPFYNTDQRSGRYAGKMYANPDFDTMTAYIMKHWPDVSDTKLASIRSYLEFCVNQYSEFLPEATELAGKRLKELRPHLSKKKITEIRPKIAQEQVRMFIPVLFPTALVFTVNFTALIAMYEEAWTPGMKDVTQRMVDAYCDKHPDARKYFDIERRRTNEFALDIPRAGDVFVTTLPTLKECEVFHRSLFVQPSPELLHPVDRLHFRPELMNNNIGSISSKVTVSLGTYGQDQRHRTVRRSKPRFTGGFYVPPLLQNIHPASERAYSLMEQWSMLATELPKTLCMLLAPYGAMVEYTKTGSFNAKLHEQGKRTCLQAQEEIRYLSLLERESVEKIVSSYHPIMNMYQPPCFETEKCAEGDRFCGRDVNSKKQKYFQRWEV